MIIGYQVVVTQKVFENVTTIEAAREVFFELARQPGNESAAIYERLSEGGIGEIVAETLAHYEQSPVKFKRVPQDGHWDVRRQVYC